MVCAYISLLKIRYPKTMTSYFSRFWGLTEQFLCFIWWELGSLTWLHWPGSWSGLKVQEGFTAMSGTSVLAVSWGILDLFPIVFSRTASQDGRWVQERKSGHCHAFQGLKPKLAQDHFCIRLVQAIFQAGGRAACVCWRTHGNTWEELLATSLGDRLPQVTRSTQVWGTVGTQSYHHSLDVNGLVMAGDTAETTDILHLPLLN